MRNDRQLFSLARQYVSYLRGNDYFRKTQGLGAYFEDTRCYYNNLRHKAQWTGTCCGGVPAIHVVKSGQDMVFPVTVLQYGIGSIDCYFRDNDTAHLDAVRRVAKWMLKDILPEGYFNTRIDEFDPIFQYYSNNGAMVQGLAISFAVRAIRYELVDSALRLRMREMLDRITVNMLLPVQQEGTVLYRDSDLYLLEYCRTDGNVVLNGWIFGVFGLFDYMGFAGNEHVEKCLRMTIDTMKRALPKYCLPNGWSYYDNMGRISSPFYHDLHIALLDAMHLLTKDEHFEKYKNIFSKANSRRSRVWYTLNKIKDKLLDKDALYD